LKADFSGTGHDGFWGELLPYRRVIENRTNIDHIHLPPEPLTICAGSVRELGLSNDGPGERRQDNHQTCDPEGKLAFAIVCGLFSAVASGVSPAV